MNRVWMAASVAVFNSHTDQGNRWKCGIKSFQPSMSRLFSGGGGAADSPSDLRPLAKGVAGTDLGEDRRKRRQATGDESLRQVWSMWQANIEQQQ
ncbi:hypothetical protein Ancab_007901 [Ancistrocladus abbreviatus]